MTATERGNPAGRSGGVRDVLAAVDKAVSDAAAALQRLEQEREQARTTLGAAEVAAGEARDVLDRLRRLRASLAGDAEQR